MVAWIAELPSTGRPYLADSRLLAECRAAAVGLLHRVSARLPKADRPDFAGSHTRLSGRRFFALRTACCSREISPWVLRAVCAHDSSVEASAANGRGDRFSPSHQPEIPQLAS